jgi:virulence factor Mce-like protein
MTPFKAGVIALVLIAVFSFFGFSRYNPFSHQFTLYATFRSANNLGTNSPVRIAGVNVGLVKEVTPLGNGSGLARVKMEIEKKGLPIHKDATAKIRSRIFLEGNFFVDLSPGTPSAPKAKAGYDIPVQQTAYPVQFGQLLTALQSDTRTDLKVFLHEYSTVALGNGGAQAYNSMLNDAPGAFKAASIANQATLGQQPHDLSHLLRGQQRLFARLDADPEALKNLITNLNTTALAFARQDVALEQAIPKLRDTIAVGRPALASLNSALPHLRAFAVDALPGAKSSPATIDATLPFIKQARGLVSKAELRGLTADLVPTVPALAKVNRTSIGLLDESRSLNACTSKVLLPFARAPIPDPDFPDASNIPFYQQASYGLVGVGGESRMNDANTPYLNVQTNAGPTTVQMRDQNGESFFAQVAQAPRAVRPLMSVRPPDRPGIPCETQEAPDMNAPAGPTEETITPSGPCSPTSDPIACIPLPRREAVQKQWDAAKSYLARAKQGLPAVDPVPYSEQAFKVALKQAGLKQDPTTGKEIPDLSLKNAAKR